MGNYRNNVALPRDVPSESGGVRKFGFLVRPTHSEFNDFVLMLDKVMSDNINKEFFRDDVASESEEERADGKVVVRAKGTVQMLDDCKRPTAA